MKTAIALGAVFALGLVVSQAVSDGQAKPEQAHGLVQRIEALEQGHAGDPPLGAILPYFGELSRLDGSVWVPCDGRDAPTGHKLTEGDDANPARSGIQVPDLRDKFLKALKRDEPYRLNGALVGGGNHTILAHKFSHKHQWSQFGPEFSWYLFGADGSLNRAIRWKDGMLSDAAGGGSRVYVLGKDHNLPEEDFPRRLTKESQKAYFTDAHEHTIPAGDNRPQFAGVYFIIKVRNE